MREIAEVFTKDETLNLEVITAYSVDGGDDMYYCGSKSIWRLIEHVMTYRDWLNQVLEHPENGLYGTVYSADRRETIISFPLIRVLLLENNDTTSGVLEYIDTWEAERRPGGIVAVTGKTEDHTADQLLGWDKVVVEVVSAMVDDGLSDEQVEELGASALEDIVTSKMPSRLIDKLTAKGHVIRILPTVKIK